MLFHALFIIFRGCLLVRQSFFHRDRGNFTQIGGGVLGCRGFHSSFRATQGGLSLNVGEFLCRICIVCSRISCGFINMKCVVIGRAITARSLCMHTDVSTTTIIQPGPVMQFLVSNQNVRGPRGIDWNRVLSLAFSGFKFMTYHCDRLVQSCIHSLLGKEDTEKSKDQDQSLW